MLYPLSYEGDTSPKHAGYRYPVAIERRRAAQ